MYTRRFLRSVPALLCCLALLGCEEDTASAAAAATASSEPPPLQDLALPVSLRKGDGGLTAPYVVEATPDHLWFDSRMVLELDRGKVKDADRADGKLPALEQAMKAGTRSGIALRLAANVWYETAALVLNTARHAGVRDAAIQVRPAGHSRDTGWITMRGFTTASRDEALPEIPGAKYGSWNDFTSHWQEAFDGCRSGMSANCAYVDENVADGGTLRIELMTSGQGVNVNFFRRGLTPEQEAEEEQKRKAQLDQKKEDFFQGRITEDEMVEVLLLGHPSTYALFQFRFQEALKGPSPLAKTMGAMCKDQSCGVVIRGDRHSQFVRVATMIGATFPDGAPLPHFAFELPWTKKTPPADLQAFIDKQKAL